MNNMQDLNYCGLSVVVVVEGGFSMVANCTKRTRLPKLLLTIDKPVKLNAINKQCLNKPE